MVGLGAGDVTLTEHADGNRTNNRSIKTDISMRMGAIGARGELLSASEAGGMSLAIKTDAFFVEMESDAVRRADGNMEASKSDASRVRLALEGSRAFDVGAETLTPRAEIGIRQDGGDAETGTGVEVGGGISHQGTGFSIEGSVRKLVAHKESGYEEWGASGSVRIDPGASGRGLSLTLRPTFGAASSGVEQLWSHRDATGLTPGGGIRSRKPVRDRAWDTASDYLELKASSPRIRASRSLRAETARGARAQGGRWRNKPRLAWKQPDRKVGTLPQRTRCSCGR